MPTKYTSFYAEPIRAELARTGYVGKYDPRHIEAWMRVERGTLDSLDTPAFRREVAISRQCCDEARPGDSERLAESYGL